MSAQVNWTKHAVCHGNIVIIGLGSVASSLLPILFRHIEVCPKHVTVFCPPGNDTTIARECGMSVVEQALSENNFEALLAGYVKRGDLVLNLSVNVSSESLVRFCWSHGALYLDTSIEPWEGESTDPDRSASRRSNYALREALLAFRLDKRDGPTAILTQGANPGLASAFVKQALVDMASNSGIEPTALKSYEDWAALAQRLNIKAIHVAERDFQVAKCRKAPNEFVNTWSVDAFVEEGMQPAELGWGTHERHWPADARRHGFGSDAAIYLQRPGLATRVRSWTPLAGSYHGFLITHGESISIADHLTLRKDGEVIYRPTVHYAYRPCDDAFLSIDEFAGRGWRLQDQKRIMRDEIVDGADELGVLLMGNDNGVYWYGSRLTTPQARRLAPHNDATSLQVVAGILAGIVWALGNPDAGVVEPDDIDYRTVMRVARPYLGEMIGVYDSWTPLAQRSQLFDSPCDDDPWQFLNIRVP
ncbi:homospermidine synthase [Paraburkholderia atlantica]|uniref:Homospermidine synthase n=2 Tax=Paraburkholderia atlantica TaxID=2654982 RepID=D5WMZ1_PARAM|nr:saccharopine dehydrogenase C-terminal domain-containing protein [Paraburkholderia atlantica]ADG20587.1 Homospermidine synthase [Paraburkholderia atlantica]